MSHTPGKWYAGNLRIKGADPRFDGCDIGASNNSNVAIVLHQESDRTKSETIANARLIAAAPELLEALEGVLQVADRGTVEFDAARAAIAKARGQA